MRLVDKIFNSMLRNTTPADTKYVSNGLVFQIDGILDQSRIPQPIVAQWEGSTKSFTESRGTVARNSANNGWYFDGATCLQASGNLISVNYATSTIEIVFKDYNGFTKNNFLFGNGRGDGNNIIAGTNTVSKFIYTPEANPAYEIQPTTDIVAISASSALGMSNGELLTASGSYSFARWGVVSIGGRPNYTTADLYGEIYAIRVYNRQLTKSEVIHNQILDYARFSSAPYTYYDYLESDGKSQYIDTGVYLGGQESYEIEVTITRHMGNSPLWICGARNGYNNNDYSLRAQNGALRYRYSYNTDYGSSYTLGVTYTIVKRGNIITFYDGDTVVYTKTLTALSARPNHSMMLFAMNNAGSAEQYFSGLRMGKVRIYDSNNVLVRDFRPAVRIADGVAGMHDVLNDVFYANANPAGDNFLYGNLT